jgi:arginyl-tRNA--protein-N-Asp/Glu arginylyltransferase
MIFADIQLRWFEFLQNIRYRRSKRHGTRSAMIETASERSIRILQNRYGFSREQAQSELSKHYSKAWLG